MAHSVTARRTLGGFRRVETTHALPPGGALHRDDNHHHHCSEGQGLEQCSCEGVEGLTLLLRPFQSLWQRRGSAARAMTWFCPHPRVSCGRRPLLLRSKAATSIFLGSDQR